MHLQGLLISNIQQFFALTYFAVPDVSKHLKNIATEQ